ncbi:ADP-ribosylglycohydrolase family protein [Verrucomicrobiales bacterium]|jgi:ADP-ribosylglycohydrolase|nr:ADP-ribosylglycohydrolase family protein [Verrucomicrobiales bacterium]MDA7926856.1 ADP-ribosylglycohydrolase family protein [Verrucomicrobiales bacterium]
MKLFTRAAVVADALSLGAHWIYDQSQIASLFPEGVTAFADPVSPYHPNRKAGELTHYGDQCLMLQDSIAKRNGFALDGWREDWLTGMANYDGYLDGATRETQSTEGRTPSGSSDLAGAARLAPILDFELSLEDAVDAARAQTALTHGDPSVADAAEFFVRATASVIKGAAIDAAFSEALESGRYEGIDVKACLERAREAAQGNIAPMKVASDFGLGCDVSGAFPLALYMALLPDTTYASVISTNALAGGDSSARGMLLAVLFAAREAEAGAALAGELKAKTE